jgi:hypothetical protein
MSRVVLFILAILSGFNIQAATTEAIPLPLPEKGIVINDADIRALSPIPADNNALVTIPESLLQPQSKPRSVGLGRTGISREELFAAMDREFGPPKPIRRTTNSLQATSNISVKIDAIYDDGKPEKIIAPKRFDFSSLCYFFFSARAPEKAISGGIHMAIKFCVFVLISMILLSPFWAAFIVLKKARAKRSNPPAPTPAAGAPAP